jgi:hypothetical protein
LALGFSDQFYPYWAVARVIFLGRVCAVVTHPFQDTRQGSTKAMRSGMGDRTKGSFRLAQMKNLSAEGTQRCGGRLSNPLFQLDKEAKK